MLAPGRENDDYRKVDMEDIDDGVLSGLPLMYLVVLALVLSLACLEQLGACTQLTSLRLLEPWMTNGMEQLAQTLGRLTALERLECVDIVEQEEHDGPHDLVCAERRLGFCVAGGGAPAAAAESVRHVAAPQHPSAC